MVCYPVCDGHRIIVEGDFLRIVAAYFYIRGILYPTVKVVLCMSVVVTLGNKRFNTTSAHRVGDLQVQW